MSNTESGDDLLLGRQVPPVTGYSPEILHPIPRATARAELAMDCVPHGADLWHAYEVSWLDHSGKPEVRVGRFMIPASSDNMVESKSFKLYLNSLNNERFEDEQEVKSVIVADVSSVVGDNVDLQLLPVDAPVLAGSSLGGTCIDGLTLDGPIPDTPSAELLSADAGDDVVEERLYSHLLRSLCPVTGQPDWATVWLHYRGRAIDRSALLRYLLAFRNHHEFHEQCVERMFHDIHCACAPQQLHLQGFYTRRGGLDINPFRSTEPGASPLPRLSRQ